MSENAIQRAVLDALQALGVVAWRSQAGKVRVRGGFMSLAPEGTPDVIGYMPDGRLLGIEVKASKLASATKPERREKQAAWRERAAAAGCVVGVATSVDEAVRIVRAANKART